MNFNYVLFFMHHVHLLFRLSSARYWTGVIELGNFRTSDFYWREFCQNHTMRKLLLIIINFRVCCYVYLHY